MTFLLTLFIAHFLEHLFFARGIQPGKRRTMTCLALGHDLRADLGGSDQDRPRAPT